MDANKFGMFIAQCRKEHDMTQAELALKIQVTDKAVSRWERGKGFPDINTLEPLADALQISVIELMKSEKIENNGYSNVDTIDVMKSAIKLEKENRKQEYTANGLAIFTTFLVAIIFKTSGNGNLIASIFFGLLAAIAEVSVYYLLENKEDSDSRKIYGTICIAAIAMIVMILWLCWLCKIY